MKKPSFEHDGYDNSIEIWSHVNGYEGLYEVSSIGNVRSLDRVSPHPNGALRIKGQIMKYYLTADGYKRVTLCKYGARKKFLVHRLIADAFLEKDVNRGFINHIDGDRQNNNLSNLERCTPLENAINAVSRGMFHGRTNPKNRKKLTPFIADEIKKEAINGTPYKVIADAFGISISNISAIKLGRSWSHPETNGTLTLGWVQA